MRPEISTAGYSAFGRSTSPLIFDHAADAGSDRRLLRFIWESILTSARRRRRTLPSSWTAWTMSASGWLKPATRLTTTPKSADSIDSIRPTLSVIAWNSSNRRPAPRAHSEVGGNAPPSRLLRRRRSLRKRRERRVLRSSRVIAAASDPRRSRLPHRPLEQSCEEAHQQPRNGSDKRETVRVGQPTSPTTDRTDEQSGGHSPDQDEPDEGHIRGEHQSNDVDQEFPKDPDSEPGSSTDDCPPQGSIHSFTPSLRRGLAGRATDFTPLGPAISRTRATTTAGAGPATICHLPSRSKPDRCTYVHFAHQGTNVHFNQRHCPTDSSWPVAEIPAGSLRPSLISVGSCSILGSWNGDGRAGVSCGS